MAQTNFKAVLDMTVIPAKDLEKVQQLKTD